MQFHSLLKLFLKFWHINVHFTCTDAKSVMNALDGHSEKQEEHALDHWIYPPDRGIEHFLTGCEGFSLGWGVCYPSDCVCCLSHRHKGAVLRKECVVQKSTTPFRKCTLTIKVTIQDSSGFAVNAKIYQLWINTHVLFLFFQKKKKKKEVLGNVCNSS